MTSRFRTQLTVWTLGVLLVLAAAPASAEDEGDGADVAYELVYTGEFIDQDSQPISAVFPLEFSLYETEKSRKSFWSETHFVSVVDGGYTIALGRRTPLPAKATRETVYLGVELNGREVVRQPLKARVVSDEVRIGAAVTTPTADYADRAGDADTLGGFSPDEFVRQSEFLALERTVDQKVKAAASDSKPAAGGGGGYLSGKNWQSQYAGGSGGKNFTLSCPDGYVMTGMEGRSGAVLDAVRIVCQKLE